MARNVRAGVCRSHYYVQGDGELETMAWSLDNCASIHHTGLGHTFPGFDNVVDPTGFKNLDPALAYHFCLKFLTAFSEPGICNLTNTSTA